MREFVARFLVALTFFAAATLVVANPFKSKIITGTDSTLVIAVPDDHFLKITNFTQVGGTDRGVVEATLSGDTENVGTVNILTATRIDLSTGANSQNFPEIDNRVVVAGPATVKVRPVTGATLFISYKKELNNGEGGGGGEAASPTPLPIFSVVTVLHTDDRSDLAGAIDFLPVHIRQSNVPDLSRILHLLESADRFFDRHFPVDGVQLI